MHVEQDTPEHISGHKPDEQRVPGVDELEDRLRDLQGAMDKIQSGDLDAAEQAIETLEQRMGSEPT